MEEDCPILGSESFQFNSFVFPPAVKFVDKINFEFCGFCSCVAHYQKTKSVFC